MYDRPRSSSLQPVRLLADLFGTYPLEIPLLAATQTLVAGLGAAEGLVQSRVSVEVVVDLRETDAALGAGLRR